VRCELKLYVLRTNAILQPWLQKWRIKISVRKCSITLFSERRSHYHVNSVIHTLIGQIRSDFLGLHLPTYRCVQQNHRLRRLCPGLHRSSSNNINLALTIYKSLIRSTLTYAAPVGGQAANTHFNILQNFQNKLLRMITKSPRVTPIDTLNERTGMESVSNYVTRTASKFYFINQFGDKEQTGQLGQFNPTHDEQTSHPVDRPTPL